MPNPLYSCLRLWPLPRTHTLCPTPSPPLTTAQTRNRHRLICAPLPSLLRRAILAGRALLRPLRPTFGLLHLRATFPGYIPTSSTTGASQTLPFLPFFPASGQAREPPRATPSLCKARAEPLSAARRRNEPSLARPEDGELFSGSVWLASSLERLCHDGRVVFGDGSGVVADTVIYCTGYNYSFPFLDTAGAVTVDDNRVGPLFEHVFPPSLAPSLSFIGIPKRVFAPWFFESQARWVAQVLSGRRTLPSEEEMMRSVEAWYRACEIAAVPKKYTHDLGSSFETYMDEFGDKYCDFPRFEKWRYELLLSTIANMAENLETFRDDYRDTDSIRKGVEAWRLAAAQQVDDQDAAATTIIWPP